MCVYMCVGGACGGVSVCVCVYACACACPGECACAGPGTSSDFLFTQVHKAASVIRDRGSQSDPITFARANMSTG